MGPVTIQHSTCFLPRSDQDSNLLVESWSNSLRLITCVLMPNSSIGVAVQVRSGMCMHTITTSAGSDPLVVLTSITWRNKVSTDRLSEANSLPFTSGDQPVTAQANPRAAVLAGGGGRSTVRSIRSGPVLGAVVCALRRAQCAKPMCCHKR